MTGIYPRQLRLPCGCAYKAAAPILLVVRTGVDKRERMLLTTDLDAWISAFLDLEYEASRPYNVFVFRDRAQYDEIRQLLWEQRLCDFAPPHGRVLLANGEPVAMIATLTSTELATYRLGAAVAVLRSEPVTRDAELRGRLKLASRTLMSLDDGDHYLSRIAVATAARGRGFGSWLLDRFESDAANAGGRRLVLEVSPTSESAVRLYERHGFKRVDHRRVEDQVSGRVLEHLHMVKALR